MAGLPVFTRPLNSGGPYGHVPGAAPPYHARQNDPAEQANDGGNLSRLSGQDVDPLASTGGGPVGSATWDGQQTGYVGRDPADPTTWGGRQYTESPGMFVRLQQEAQQG